MRTTILTIILFVLMLSASAVHAQRVEGALLSNLYPVINCDRMPASTYTTESKGGEAKSNEKVFKRFAIMHREFTEKSWDQAKGICGQTGEWRLPTQRELQLMEMLWVPLNVMLNQITTAGFDLFVDEYYWSATEESPGKHWSVLFRSGITSAADGNRIRARCIKELP